MTSLQADAPFPNVTQVTVAGGRLPRGMQLVFWQHRGQRWIFLVIQDDSLVVILAVAYKIGSIF
jgi:hypothetical protein